MVEESALTRLARWYHAQCDGRWEHQYGITIGTLDNPGWSLNVDLTDTMLRTVPFQTVEHQLESDVSWWRCWREADAFSAACGPMDPPIIIDIFLAWAEQASPPPSA